MPTAAVEALPTASAEAMISTVSVVVEGAERVGAGATAIVGGFVGDGSNDGACRRTEE